MRQKVFFIISLLMMAPLAFLVGCGKGEAPVAPVANSSVAVTVPLTGPHGQSFGSTKVNVFYYFSGANGQPATGLAGDVSVGTGGSFTFSESFSAQTSYNYVAIQLNDYTTNQVIAVGATSFSSNTVPVTLGPVNKSVYEVSGLGAGQAFGFESDSIVNVGLSPAATAGLDMFTNTTSTGFELDNLGSSNSNVAYMGNGYMYNYLKVPSSGSFQNTSTASKALQTTPTDVAPGDVYCVKLAAGGYAWLQITSVTSSGVAFIYRVNTTLSYCGYEQTMADLNNTGSGNPTATPTTSLAPVSVVGTFSGSFTPYDVAPFGPTNSVAATVFVSNSSNGNVYAFTASGALIQSFTGTGVLSSVGLAVDPNGTYLYAADPSGKMVNQFSTSTLTWINCIGNGASFSGSDSTGLAGAGSLAKPRYVSLDNLGNLFIADAGTAGFADVMEYYGPTIPLIATTNVNYWTGSLSSSAVTNCVGQICNAGTTVIVANSANNRIDFYPANETTGYAGTPLSSISSDNNSSNAVAFNDPQGVAYSASTGYLYISDTGNNRIVEMTLSGSFVRILGPTIGAATLSGPTGIKLDGAQPPFVYVADTGNGRVLKLQ